MDTLELIGHGVPATIASLWREQQGERLLPLQEKAVRECALFTGDNLLVQAPTSSGKTFVGEMAAVHAALQRRKTAYLLPLKALAEEKYRAFRARYEAYGLRVIICTRDRRAFDDAFARGDFDIAVAVYEKLDHLAAARPERLRELSLVVADELEALSDADRGAAIETLLTGLHVDGVRIIGLSAVLGAAEQPAAWLNAHLLDYGRRPVELRYGVLHEGTFRYREHNTQDEDEEALTTSHGDTPWEEVMSNVGRLAEAGERCLVFVKARREAWHGAELLARRVSLPAATTAIEKLHACEPTRSRDLLLHTLETGVAFHSADLLPAERRIVETAFRSGAAKVLVATSTLAVGMNLPARNVFVSADKWIYDPRLDLPWRAPISQAEFENMSGRAGRYAPDDVEAEPGRAILVAASLFDRDALWRRYVTGRREPVASQLAQAPLEDHVLRLVASRCRRTMDGLAAFFAKTLAAHTAWAARRSDEETRFRIGAAVRRCLDTGMMQAIAENGATIAVNADTDLETLAFEATPAGRVTATKGVSLACARVLRHWLRLCERRDWPALDLLTALTLAPDARLRQVSLTRYEYETADYPAQLKKQTAMLPIDVDTPLNRLRNCRLAPFHDEARAIKAALFLNDWIEEMPLHEIEAAYDVSAGQIRDAAHQVSWLADAAATLADAEQLAEHFAEKVRCFSERLHHGVGETLAPVARIVSGAPRNALLRLADAGLNTPEALHATSEDMLEPWLTPRQIHAVKQWAEREVKERDNEGPDSAPILLVDDTRPGRITLNGVTITLQEKQYRLIRTLAAHPGQCVSYETIYRDMWGDVIVEDNQMHYQKRMLVKRLASVDAQYKALITTVAKRGFTLALRPEQVCLRTTATCAA